MKIVIDVDPGELTPAMMERNLYLLGRELEKYGPLALVALHSPWMSFVVTKIEGKAEKVAGAYDVIPLES